MIYLNNNDMPIGLGMMIVQNEKIMKYFSSLSVEKQMDFIENAKGIKSKEAMRDYVNGIADRY